MSTEENKQDELTEENKGSESSTPKPNSAVAVVASKERKERRPKKDVEERVSVLEDENESLRSQLNTLTEGLTKAKSIKTPRPNSDKSLLDEINEMLFN